MAEYNLENDIGVLANIIAMHRVGKSKEAIKLFDRFSTIDPYLIELKGQIYYESGMAKQAIKEFNKADKLMPNEALIKIQLARSIISAKEKAQYDEAIKKPMTTGKNFNGPSSTSMTASSI